MHTKKKLSKRKLMKLIWLTVSKRNHEDHIAVTTVVIRPETDSVLIVKKEIAVSRNGYIDYNLELSGPKTFPLGISMMDIHLLSVGVVTCKSHTTVKHVEKLIL